MQISESLRQKIKSGEIAEKLPSKAELGRTYDVGDSTIERALKVLKADGVVESVQGAGVYVTGTGDRRPLVDKLTDLLRGPDVQVGNDFPTEDKLCERFTASRTAVRSALALMEGRGLIGKGASGRRQVLALPDVEGSMS